MKNVIILTDLPPTAVPRLAGLKTRRRARRRAWSTADRPRRERRRWRSVCAAALDAVVMNARAGEPANTTSRLIADQQGADDARSTDEAHHTLTLSDRWLAPKPPNRPAWPRPRLQTDRNAGRQRYAPRSDVENFQSVIGRVHREEPGAVRRHCDWTHRSAFKPGERPRQVAWMAAVDGGRSSAMNSVAADHPQR